MHADGAGTKSSLAYAYWRETGDLSVWRGIAQDALIMNIDDFSTFFIITEEIIPSIQEQHIHTDQATARYFKARHAANRNKANTASNINT